MTQIAISSQAATSPFDEIMEIDVDGAEVWRARKLMALMGYPRWADFQRVLARAMAAARNSGLIVEEVFRRSPENPSDQGGRPREDFKLVRRAAYLTALNGDPNKVEIASAQMYFVDQTRAQEVSQRTSAQGSDDLAVIEKMIEALRADRQRLAALEAVQVQQSERQRELEARLDGIEGLHDWFSALAYAKMHGLNTERAYLQRLGTAAGRISRRDGLQPKKTQHALFGWVNQYPLRALDEAVELVGRS